MKDENNVMNGNPFIASEVDYAIEYSKHLQEDTVGVPFYPQSGIIERTCDLCYYRQQDGDCGTGIDNDGELVKNLFGISLDVEMPTEIDGEQVGYYCPYWRDTSS